MWTDYDHPKDYPHCFVARQWVISKGQERPTANVIVGPNLESVRLILAQYGLSRIPRDLSDDPVIVETWL